jgi:hypothetical protein
MRGTFRRADLRSKGDCSGVATKWLSTRFLKHRQPSFLEIFDCFVTGVNRKQQQSRAERRRPHDAKLGHHVLELSQVLFRNRRAKSNLHDNCFAWRPCPSFKPPRTRGIWLVSIVLRQRRGVQGSSIRNPSPLERDLFAIIIWQPVYGGIVTLVTRVWENVLAAPCLPFRHVRYNVSSAHTAQQPKRFLVSDDVLYRTVAAPKAQAPRPASLSRLRDDQEIRVPRRNQMASITDRVTISTHLFNFSNFKFIENVGVRIYLITHKKQSSAQIIQPAQDIQIQMIRSIRLSRISDRTRLQNDTLCQKPHDRRVPSSLQLTEPNIIGCIAALPRPICTHPYRLYKSNLSPLLISPLHLPIIQAPL